MMTITACFVAAAASGPSLWANGWKVVGPPMGFWPLAALALLFVYYFLVYRLLLGVPSQAATIPQYAPPNNASPMLLRFMERRTFDEKSFAAAVLDLAARGYMETTGGHSEPYVFWRGKDYMSIEASLPPDEQVLAHALFKDGDILRIDLGHAGLIQHLKKTMIECTESLIAPYFRSARGYIIGGILLAITTFLALIIQTMAGGSAMVACVMIVVFGSIATFAWNTVIRSIRQSLDRRSLLGWLMAIGASASAIPALVLSIACVLLLVLVARLTSVAFAVYLLGALLAIAVSSRRPRVLTEAGRQFLDAIDGYRHFLATVEADQLNRISSSTTAPEMINKALPYAVAFDLEHRWASQRFAHAFGFAGGEYVSSSRLGSGSILPQGVKLPNPFDMLALAAFLSDVAPSINGALAEAHLQGRSPYSNTQEVLQVLDARSRAKRR